MHEIEMPHALDPPIGMSLIQEQASRADPEFPVGGGSNCPGGERQHANLPNFPKNSMKLRKFRTVGEGAGAECTPLNPPLNFTNFSVKHSIGTKNNGLIHLNFLPDINCFNKIAFQ